MMLSYEEALQKIDQTVEKLPAVDNAITHILGHVLADSITATFDLPRFDNSAMDGYGVRGEDLLTITDDKPKELALIGVIEAGSQKVELKIERGKAVKIFTGAKVPPSVDTVVMKEYCDDLDSAVRIKERTEAGSNIRRAGEEFRKGDLVLPSGILVTPPVVGLIASFGHARFKVYEKPRITIIGTGDELVAPGGELSASQIYDSNSYALAAAIQALGLPRPIRFNIKDQEDQIETALKEALRQTDMIITTGGVSVGDRDLVKEVLEKRLGVETVFWRAKVKPGKPIYFGTTKHDGRQKLIFGLPGNPVSALTTFNLFVKPALAKMQGLIEDGDCKPERLKARISRSLKKKPGRLDFVRGLLSLSDDGVLTAAPTAGQDSHMLSGLARANCLIEFDEEAAKLDEGDLVTIQKLIWSEY